jgi:hypothetical protein
MTLTQAKTLSQKPFPSIPHPTQSMSAVHPTPKSVISTGAQRSGEIPALAFLRPSTIRVPYPLALFAKGWGIERSSTALLHGSKTLSFLLLGAAVLLITPPLHAQESQPKAMQALQAAVQSELAAAESDKSNWQYRDHDVTAGRNAIYQTIETPHGQLRRLIELNGHPLDDAARNAETDRIAQYVNDPTAQFRAHKADAHDDAQATEMTRMLPKAFIWTVTSEAPEFITLSYRPNPAFDPPDMEARVMSIMAGEMIIARDGNRIRTLKGALTQDVKFGWGIFGRLYAGGTFDIERREVAPGHWQITESNVHIGGHALIFKTIGQQEDESKTDWKPSTAKTLHEAEEQLRDAR